MQTYVMIYCILTLCFQIVSEMAEFTPEWPYNQCYNRPAPPRNPMMYGPGCVRFQQLPQPFTAWTGHSFPRGYHNPWGGHCNSWGHQNPHTFMEMMTEMLGHCTPSRQNQNQTRQQAEHPGMKSGSCCKDRQQSQSQDEGGARPEERKERTAKTTSSSQCPEECPRKTKEDSRGKCCNDYCYGHPSSSSSARSSREEPEASNPFEFIQEVLEPMFADFMRQRESAANDAKQHQEKPCTSAHHKGKQVEAQEASHPFEQACDDAFDLMLDMAAPYMDDISAIFNPETPSAAGNLSKSQQGRETSKLNKGQGKMSSSVEKSEAAQTTKKSDQPERATKPVNAAVESTQEKNDYSKSGENKKSEDTMKSDKATTPGQSSKSKTTSFDFMREIVQPIFQEMSQGIHQQQFPHNGSPTHHVEPSCPVSDCDEYKTIPTWFGPMRVKVSKKCCTNPIAQKDKSETKSQQCSKEDVTKANENTASSSESEKSSNEEKITSGVTKASSADESNGGDASVQEAMASMTDTEDAQGNSDGFDEATQANKGNEGDLQTSAEDTEPIALGYNLVSNEQLMENSKAEANDNVQEPTADEPELNEHSEDDGEEKRDNDVQESMEDEPQPQLSKDVKDSEDVQEPHVIEPYSDDEFVVVGNEMKSDGGEPSDHAAVVEFQNEEQEFHQPTNADTPPNDQLNITEQHEHNNDITKYKTNDSSSASVSEPKVWSATFNLSDYDLSDVSVKTVGQRLVVEAEHEEETNDGVISQQFRKSITLPADVDPESISCSMDDAGVLHVKAFRLENNVTSEHKVHIAMT